MSWQSKFHTRDIALCAMMAALLEVSKLVLCWAASVELVSLLILLFACRLGWRVIPATLAFVGLEILIWGFGIWTVSYIYVWPGLGLLGLLLKKAESPLFWAIVAAFFGLAFGALCAIPYLFMGGWAFAVSWWVSGIPFDLVHAVANFVIVLLLWKPLSKLLLRLTKNFDR